MIYDNNINKLSNYSIISSDNDLMNLSTLTRNKIDLTVIISIASSGVSD